MRNLTIIVLILCCSRVFAGSGQSYVDPGTSTPTADRVAKFNATGKFDINGIPNNPAFTGTATAGAFDGIHIGDGAGLTGIVANRPNILRGNTVFGTNSTEISFDAADFNGTQSGNRSVISLSSRIQWIGTNTVFTVPSAVTTIYVTMCGAGSGGSGGTRNDEGFGRDGAIGGGGHSIIDFPLTVTPAATYTVSIGLGGTGGTAGGDDGGNGVAGGATSFGSLLSANGASGASGGSWNGNSASAGTPGQINDYGGFAGVARASIFGNASSYYGYGGSAGSKGNPSGTTGGTGTSGFCSVKW